MKNRSIITRVILPGLALVALALLGSSTAWGQSSGNFTATVDNTVCSINTMDGSQVPPGQCNTTNPLCFTNTGGGSLTTTIKLPNSSPGLLVTPSLVTGMYTNTGSFSTGSGSGFPQTAAIVVVVTDKLEPSGPTVTLTPNQTCVDTSTAGITTCTPTSTDPNCKCGVVYDERFQQILSFFGSGSFDSLILSTMAAHSFNFTEGNVPGGIHTVKVNWYFGCDSGGTGSLHTAQCMSTFTPNTAAACAGPGNLTVQQVQNFQHDSQIQTTGPTGP